MERFVVGAFLIAAVLWIVVAVSVVVLCALAILTLRLRTRIRLQEAETHHLVVRRLPALMDVERGLPIDVPGPLDDELAETSFGQDVQTVVGQFAGFTKESQQRAERTARATLISSMRRLREHADELNGIIAELPDKTRTRVELEHRLAQLIRRTQATSLLCGSRPAQRRAVTSLHEVIDTATARIQDHSRIEVDNGSNTSVRGRCAEPVTLVVAELLDNATRYSPSSTPVHVHFQSAHNGVSVIIDDAGPGIVPDQLERAQALLGGREAADINRIGDPPRVGFALAGLLATRQGFKTFVEPGSPYGGTRAVLFLPNELLGEENHNGETSSSVSATEPWHRGTLMGAHAKLPDGEELN